jgi:hypothetical protein
VKRSSRIALALAVVLLGAAGVVLLLTVSDPPARPETLIRNALRQAEEAARNRDVGGVMDIVSDDYKDASGFNKARLRLILARSFQQAGNMGMGYDVRVSVPQVVFDERKAGQALATTTVAAVETGSGENLWGGQPVTLVFRRERVRRWLLFSEDRWRVTSIVNLPPLPGFVGEEGGGGGGIFGL